MSSLKLHPKHANGSNTERGPSRPQWIGLVVKEGFPISAQQKAGVQICLSEAKPLFSFPRFWIVVWGFELLPFVEKWEAPP